MGSIQGTAGTLWVDEAYMAATAWLLPYDSFAWDVPCLVQWYSKALLPGTLRPWLQWGALLQWYLFCMHYVLVEILHPKTARYSCHQNGASPHMKKDYGLLYWMEDSQSINVVSPTAANGSIIMAVPSKFGVTKGVECIYPCTLWSQTVVNGI